MTIISTVMTLATKGEPVKAETVAGEAIQAVEFFAPDAFAGDDDRCDWDGITLDMPVPVWQQMGEPTEITFSVLPGNQLEEYGNDR